jgi:lysophospholipase L1-like esterase
MLSSRSGAAKNLALAAASVLLFLAVTEGGSRFAERMRGTTRQPAAYIGNWQTWDSDFYTVKSTAVGWPPWEDYNSDGLRDYEHAIEKDPGARRVVCLGDSVTQGFGLLPEEAWPQVLEELLQSRGSDDEVFNVALGSWTTRQELIAYRRIAREYHPDLVLLGICLNDVPEMQNNLTRPPRWLSSLYQRSALVRLLFRAKEREIASVEELFSEKDSRNVRDGFSRMFAEIQVLRGEVEQDGARLAVLVFPFRFQVEPGAPPSTAQETIVEFCRHEGLPVLDLLPAIRRIGPDAFHDYDHFSVEGSRLVAEEALAFGPVSSQRATSDAAPAPRERILPPRSSPSASETRMPRSGSGPCAPSATWALPPRFSGLPSRRRATIPTRRSGRRRCAS